MVKIKGSPIADTFDSIRTKFGDEGVQQILDALSDESRLVLGTGNVLASSWYSLDAFAELLEVEINTFYKGDRTALIGLSEKVVERQLKGIYRVFLRLIVSPETIVGKITNMNNTYFQGISGKARLVAPQTFISRYEGFQINHQIIEYVIHGYFRAALRLCGAKNINTNFSTPIKAGKPFCEITISWG